MALTQHYGGGGAAFMPRVLRILRHLGFSQRRLISRDVSLGQYLPTFERIVVLSSFWTTLKTKALPFVEMSAATGPLTRRHIPDVAIRRFML